MRDIEIGMKMQRCEACKVDLERGCVLRHAIYYKLDCPWIVEGEWFGRRNNKPLDAIRSFSYRMVAVRPDQESKLQHLEVVARELL